MTVRLFVELVTALAAVDAVMTAYSGKTYLDTTNFVLSFGIALWGLRILGYL